MIYNKNLNKWNSVMVLKETRKENNNNNNNNKRKSKQLQNMYSSVLQKEIDSIDIDHWHLTGFVKHTSWSSWEREKLEESKKKKKGFLVNEDTVYL